MEIHETYIAALRWFGWKEARARQIVSERASAGTLDGLDHLVRQYKLTQNKSPGHSLQQ